MPLPLVIRRSAFLWTAAFAAPFLVGCASGAGAAPVGPVPESGPAAAPVEAPPPPARRDLLGSVAYDLPVEANGWVEQELDFLVGQRRDVIARWMQRADYYEPFVKRTLGQQGVPTDLHHLAMIESGFVPTIRSRAGAVGIWQFMPATGRGMGLRIDSLVDERMDPVRSTVAAARHLRSLNSSFGNWSLAAAAYNAGSGRISRGLRDSGSRDFWELSVRGTLAAETRQYVPRLYAMTIIARDRERWGFPVPQGVVRSFAFDSVEVDLATPLPELARIGNVPADQLAALNPHLLRSTTPPGRYWVWAPRGSGPAMQAAYQSSDFRREGGIAPYTVRSGEDLRTVAELAGTTVDRLRQLNPALGNGGASPGQRLLLPKAAAERLAARPVLAAASPPSSKPALAPPKQQQTPAKPANAAPAEAAVAAAAAPDTSRAPRTHRVAEGESVFDVAERFGIAFTELLAANGMETAEIRPGQVLRIPAGASTAVAPAAPARKPVMVSPSPGEHVVQSGETLWGIAGKYGTTVPALRSENGMGEDAVIVPGQKLRIPVERISR